MQRNDRRTAERTPKQASASEGGGKPPHSQIGCAEMRELRRAMPGCGCDANQDAALVWGGGAWYTEVQGFAEG